MMYAVVLMVFTLFTKMNKCLAVRTHISLSSCVYGILSWNGQHG